MPILLTFFVLFSLTINGVILKEENFDDPKKSEACEAPMKHKKEWFEFDWKSYIKKDVQPGDLEDPMKRFGIHLINSINVGVNRTVPDNRNAQCKQVDWTKSGKLPLPDVSVIITFRDEPRSTLLRTVVSVLERSPGDLIKEIILVDDNNDDATVGQELAAIKKVKVLRNDKREGLIRSRIKGTLEASAEVLLFLDSHCEVEPGWLEPLLVRIVDNPKRLVSPVIENIRLDNYEFEAVSTYLRGGFDWRLDFFWEWLPAKDRARRLRDPTLSFKTPAIAGGLFAINRQWFLDLGIYDSAMEIWGGENIEISLRIWMCGGEMEIVPCSKVGHVYKQTVVYSYPKGSTRTTKCNTKRVADVWLEQFSILYGFTQSPADKAEDCGSVEERLQLKNDLQCKSFEWFITEIYPELMIPAEGDFAFGQIHTDPTRGMIVCLDEVAMGSDDGRVGVNGCLQSYPPQLHRYTHLGQIIQDDFCLTATKRQSGSIVLMTLCQDGNEDQLWDRVRPPAKIHKEKPMHGHVLQLRGTKYCLDISDVKTDKGLVLKNCDFESPKQRFAFTYQIVKA